MPDILHPRSLDHESRFLIRLSLSGSGAGPCFRANKVSSSTHGSEPRRMPTVFFSSSWAWTLWAQHATINLKACCIYRYCRQPNLEQTSRFGWCRVWVGLCFRVHPLPPLPPTEAADDREAERPQDREFHLYLEECTPYSASSQFLCAVAILDFFSHYHLAMWLSCFQCPGEKNLPSMLNGLNLHK